MDTIVKYLFAEQNTRLDKLEKKVDTLEQHVKAILDAIQTSESTKERLVLGRQQGNGEETQHRSTPQTQGGSTDACLICG